MGGNPLLEKDPNMTTGLAGQRASHMSTADPSPGVLTDKMWTAVIACVPVAFILLIPLMTYWLWQDLTSINYLCTCSFPVEWHVHILMKLLTNICLNARLCDIWSLFPPRLDNLNELYSDEQQLQNAYIFYYMVLHHRVDSMVQLHRYQQQQ